MLRRAICPFFNCLFADVALVTSLRDGMNLVSYEFVACQDAKKGVLILSEVMEINGKEIKKKLHLTYGGKKLYVDLCGMIFD